MTGGIALLGAALVLVSLGAIALGVHALTSLRRVNSDLVRLLEVQRRGQVDEQRVWRDERSRLLTAAVDPVAGVAQSYGVPQSAEPTGAGDEPPTQKLWRSEEDEVYEARTTASERIDAELRQRGIGGAGEEIA